MVSFYGGAFSFFSGVEGDDVSMTYDAIAAVVLLFGGGGMLLRNITKLS